MKLQVELVKEGFELYAKPRCLNSVRACNLVNRNYLTAQEIKTFELMGFEINIKEKKS